MVCSCENPEWRDEGAIFTYQVDNQWDVMYAPDLVEVKEKMEQKNTICILTAADLAEKRWLPKGVVLTDLLHLSTLPKMVQEQ